MRKRFQQVLPASFTYLNLTQFFGALNDNVFKLLVVFLLVGILGEERRATVVVVAQFLFVLPFLLFAQASGVLADRVPKARVIVWAKVLEVAVMLLGCVAVFFQSPWGLYACIFLMCTQSTLFGPAKYGVIPELVSVDKLSRANSLMVGFTYLAIIVGTFAPSFLMDRVFGSNYLLLALSCVALATAGLVASTRIPRTEAGGSEKRIVPFFFVEIFRTLREAARDRYLFLSIVASSYFLFLGGFIQQNALLYGQEFLGLTIVRSGYLFPLAALGIGLGAYLAGKVSGRNIEFGIVPVGAAALTIGCIGLGLAPASIGVVVTLIFVIGLGSGLFIVPLNAFIQYRSPREKRGQILAANSFLSFSGVALSAGLILLLSRVLKISAREGFLVVGLLTGLLAAATVLVLPDFLVRFVVVVITKVFYRIRVIGETNLPVEGPALLVPNHVTWVDALLLCATTQRRIRFVMSRQIAEGHWLRPVFRLMRVILISPDDPPRQIVTSLKEARGAMDEGYLVCIFAEGGLTRNGNLQSFKSGMERIIKGLDYPIIPVHIGGAWGSIFSYCYGKVLSTFPRLIPYPVTISFGEPMPSTATSVRVRGAVLELSCGYYDSLKQPHRTLPWQFVNAARLRWFRPAVFDTSGKRLAFGRFLTGAVALGRELEAITAGQTNVGVLLPATAAAALVNAGLCVRGKVPVNLNFTASNESMASALKQAGIATVVSSRAFVAKLDGCAPPDGTVYLEDIAASIGMLKKLSALLTAAFAPIRAVMGGHAPGPDDVATIIFSSGSTGEPKGVMLSHHNIISNIEGFRDIFGFTGSDGMCGGLPFFHSFGFTCTLWCPLLTGFRVAYHPNPLDGSAIAELVRNERLTVLLATPTFLLTYLRRAEREDFQTLRSVMVGAEKLKTKLADSFEERFGVRPLEGYGATELSPVVAVSLHDTTVGGVTQVGGKQGSVGHPIPGVAVKVVDPDTQKLLEPGQEGLLLVKGPNVMTGYLGQPDLTARTVVDGWYNSGDIARIDEDGFIFLVDRLSRYSKIGGEMVPHVAVEDALLAKLGSVDRVVAVTSADDERKGEQLIVFCTHGAGDVNDLYESVRHGDLPNLWRPKKQNFVRVDSIPVLGSGKTDLKKLRQMAQEFVAARPSGFQRAINTIRDRI